MFGELSDEDYTTELNSLIDVFNAVKEELRAEPIDDVLSGLKSVLAPTENGWFTRAAEVRPSLASNSCKPRS